MCVCACARLRVCLEEFSLTFPVCLVLLRLHCGRKQQKRFVSAACRERLCASQSIRMSLTVKFSSDNFPPFVAFGE